MLNEPLAPITPLFTPDPDDPPPADDWRVPAELPAGLTPIEYVHLGVKIADQAKLRAALSNPSSPEEVAISLSLHGEIEQLRALLQVAIERARETAAKDPILAVSRLTMAVARVVQVQRALDEGKPDEFDLLTNQVLDELDARDLMLSQVDGKLPAW